VPEPEPEVAPESGSVDRQIAWINAATEAELSAAGLAKGPLAVVLSERPFADVAALSRTRGIGPKTVAALLAACDAG
jgi:DNA uptake protein ComE-like DNA-binding protein